jgi:hypothetical protein
MRLKLTLQTSWQKADIRVIRLMLKRLLRGYGLKCVEITLVDDQEDNQQ